MKVNLSAVSEARASARATISLTVALPTRNIMQSAVAAALCRRTPNSAQQLRASTYKWIVFDPKSPRLRHPLLGVINSHSRAARNLSRRDGNAFFDPNSTPQQIGLIQSAINAQRET